MGRGKHTAGKSFFKGGKCHVSVTGQREGGRGRLKTWEERWTWTASGASPALCLQKLTQPGSSCGRYRDVGVSVAYRRSRKKLSIFGPGIIHVANTF